MTQLSFFVSGLPITQGGMKPVPDDRGGTRLITTGGDGLKQWRKKTTDIAQLAANLAHWVQLTGPVEISYRFLLPMPGSRPAAQRKLGIAYSWKKPDLDKLMRAISDSLTDAKIWVDDGQVAVSHTAKYEVWDPALTGVEVVVRGLDNDTDQPLLVAFLDRTRAHRRR